MTALIKYILHLADTTLILGHRNSEWTGHGPILEQDIAISNIALDLIGQSRNFYQYAAEVINKNQVDVYLQYGANNIISEDDLAYLRSETSFANYTLVEMPRGDWAQSIVRQFLFSAFQYEFYQQLIKSSDTQLAAIAEKSFKETTYHLRWSSEWVIRLGDGTLESHERTKRSINDLWKYTTEFFRFSDYEKEVSQQGIGVDVEALQPHWHKRVTDIFNEATLSIPATLADLNTPIGKEGHHSTHLTDILSEMQFLQRTYPQCNW